SPGCSTLVSGTMMPCGGPPCPRAGARQAAQTAAPARTARTLNFMDAPLLSEKYEAGRPRGSPCGPNALAPNHSPFTTRAQYPCLRIAISFLRPAGTVQGHFLRPRTGQPPQRRQVDSIHVVGFGRFQDDGDVGEARIGEEVAEGGLAEMALADVVVA